MAVYDFASSEAKLKERVAAVTDSSVLRKTAEAANLFPIAMPELKNTLVGSIKKINALAWSNDSKLICSSDQGGKVIIWDPKCCLKLSYATQNFVLTTCFHPTEKKIYVGGMDNLVTVYDYSDESNIEFKKLKELQEHDGYVGSCVFASNTQFLTTGGDAKIVLWDATKNTKVSQFLGHQGDAGSIKFPKVKGSSFVTSSTDGTVRVWDMRTGKGTHAFKTSGECNSCAFFPSGQAIAAACHNGEAFLYDLRSCGQLQKFVRKGARASAIEFSSSGRIMYCAYEDGFVGLWDTFGSGGYKQKLDAHASNTGTSKIIAHLAVSPDGTAFATGAYDAKIKIWGA